MATLSAMSALGAKVSIEDDCIVVEGVGGDLQQPQGSLDMGNSGTGMRLLTGLLSGFDISAQLEGDRSLSNRPMGRIKRPLDMMGADIELQGEDGRPPIKVRGGGLKAIEYDLPVASAQVKSCVLLAGMMATGRTLVREPRPTRDHTERLMAAMGLPIEVDGLTISINGSAGKPLKMPARDWVVPGDFSSAAFWMVAAAAKPGGAITIPGLGLNPRRTALMDVLRRMGAEISIANEKISDSGERYGDVSISGARLKGTVVGGDEIPNLIDECPLVAVAGAMAEGETLIRDAAELRVKESDRIAVMCKSLKDAGVEVEEREDGMLVRGDPARIRGGNVVDSHGDHRIAMAMSVLALFAEEAARIEDVECVQTSYPEFWEHLRAIGARLEFCC